MNPRDIIHTASLELGNGHRCPHRVIRATWSSAFSCEMGLIVEETAERQIFGRYEAMIKLRGRNFHSDRSKDRALDVFPIFLFRGKMERDQKAGIFV
jgi:hypothetical protein